MTHFSIKSFTSKLTIIFAACIIMSVNMSAVTPKTGEVKATETVEASQSLKLVRGFVVDEFGEPMVGVVVDALSSHNTTITNTEGKYSLLASNDDILKFSQIGAADKEEKITSSRIVNVELAVE